MRGLTAKELTELMNYLYILVNLTAYQKGIIDREEAIQATFESLHNVYKGLYDEKYNNNANNNPTN